MDYIDPSVCLYRHRPVPCGGLLVLRNTYSFNFNGSSGPSIPLCFLNLSQVMLSLSPPFSSRKQCFLRHVRHPVRGVERSSQHHFILHYRQLYKSYMFMVLSDSPLSVGRAVTSTPTAGIPTPSLLRTPRDTCFVDIIISAYM